MQPNRYINGATGQVTTRRDFSNDTPQHRYSNRKTGLYTYLQKERTEAEHRRKIAHVSTETLWFFNLVDGNPIKDINQSNKFKYRGSIGCTSIWQGARVNWITRPDCVWTYIPLETSPEIRLCLCRPMIIMDRNYTAYFLVPHWPTITVKCTVSTLPIAEGLTDPIMKISILLSGDSMSWHLEKQSIPGTTVQSQFRIVVYAQTGCNLEPGLQQFSGCSDWHSENDPGNRADLY